MKRILLAAIVALVLTSCSDPATAIKALEAMGFTDIQTHGYAPFMCGKDDTFATKFTARNPQGRSVSGAVCNGWLLKGATVRFD